MVSSLFQDLHQPLSWGVSSSSKQNSTDLATLTMGVESILPTRNHIVCHNKHHVSFFV